MKLEIGFDGTNKLVNNLARVRDAKGHLVARALYREAQAIMTESKQNYCPVDTGNLRASGTVLEPEVSGNQVVVTLGYGGAAAGYALKVHENPRAGKTGGVSPRGNKYKHWSTVGQWKYLETPVLLASRTMEARLAVIVQQDIQASLAGTLVT